MSNTKKLKICFTSDIHGYFYPTTYGDTLEKPLGLFGCASDFNKEENPNTLVIDGGDILQGSAFAYYCKSVLNSPENIADMMNDCGYDFYTLGNHDFNYGLDYQNAYHNKANATCVCQNVVDNNGNVLFPWKIRTMPNGLKVGIVGIVTDFINVWEKPENLEGIKIISPFESAKKALEEMKDKVDLTVCVYHGGFESDLETGERLSKTTENVAYKICKELDFDILLTGHQHMHVDGRDLFGTFTVQPMENGKEYHIIEVELDGESKKITSELRTSNPNRGENLKEKYSKLEAEVQEWLNQPIGHLSRDIMPEDKVKMALYGSPIADFINRIQFYFSHAQISAVGLANEIAGFHKEVSTRDIIATYPYPNTLVVCKINGKQLKKVMERSAEYFSVDENGNPVVSDKFLIPKVEHYNYDYYAGVDYEIHPENAEGNRIVNLTFEGKPVKETDEFTMCLNNYRFSGAGGYEVYNECECVKEINTEMVELIMDFFTQNPHVEV